MDDEVKNSVDETVEDKPDANAADNASTPVKSETGDNKKMILLIALGCAVCLALGVFLTLLLTRPAKDDKKLTPTPTESAVTTEEKTETAGTETVGSETAGTETKETETAGTETGDAKTETNGTETTAPETAKPTEAPAATEGFTLSYSSNNSWESGATTMFGMEIGITNNNAAAIDSWTLVLTIPGLSEVTGWNGNFKADGDTLTVTNVEYNGTINGGGSTGIGCNLGTTNGKLEVTKATLNGSEMTVKKGSVPQNNQNNQNNNQNNNNGQNNNQNNQNGNNQNGNQDANASVNVEELLKRSEAAVQGDDWLHTDGNKILDKNGKQVWLTGLNWFGYNTGTNTFDGLWNSELVSTVKGIADHGFNLIRVPMSAELLLQWKNGEYPKANYNNAYNTALNSMNSLEIWDYFLALAEANGIKVMPDIHSAETNASGHNVNMWCTDKISVDQYYEALEWLADRYKDNDTIIAIDLKNEPHGKPFEGANAAIWNDSKSPNNWKYVAETAAAKILAKNPNVLIMIEGTEIFPMDLDSNSDYHSTDEKDYYFNWWGGNLRAVKLYPINLGKYQNKLVYSPHDYGPTVYEQPWFKGDYNYDSLMKDCWQDNWLYIHKDNTAPLLIGEWGGFMREPNLTWMTYMRKLISTYHLNHTFWCLNANSGDTGGLLLDDFTTWDSEKYAFVKEVLWQEGGKFVGLDHAIPLGDNGITLSKAKGLGK